VFLGTQDKVDLCQEIRNRIWIHDQVIELYTCLQQAADVDSGSGVEVVYLEKGTEAATEAFESRAPSQQSQVLRR
jgi:hypothetical protein